MARISFHTFLGTFLGIALLMPVLVGCDEEVTAVLGTDIPYSLYGVLSPQIDTQSVRVYAIEGRLVPTTNEPLDATFTSTNLTTGDRQVWRDSLFREPDGQVAHVFWAPFTADYGHTYEIQVERSDGAISLASTTVPDSLGLEFEEPSITVSAVVQPFLIRNANPHLLRIEVAYHIKFGLGPAERTERTHIFDYNGKQRIIGNDVLIPVNLSADHRTIVLAQQVAGEWNVSFGIALLGMEIRMIVASEDWQPPKGVFDPDVIVQPGIMNNVENGFGFVGAGFRLEKRWRPTKEVFNAAGFNELPGEE